MIQNINYIYAGEFRTKSTVISVGAKAHGEKKRRSNGDLTKSTTARTLGRLVASYLIVRAKPSSFVTGSFAIVRQGTVAVGNTYLTGSVIASTLYRHEDFPNQRLQIRKSDEKVS